MKVFDVSTELTKLGFNKPTKLNLLNGTSKLQEHDMKKHQTLQYPLVKQTG